MLTFIIIKYKFFVKGANYLYQRKSRFFSLSDIKILFMKKGDNCIISVSEKKVDFNYKSIYIISFKRYQSYISHV